jgi:thymidylate synthase (FAD)
MYTEPKITLVTWTNEPVRAVASQINNMFGNMTHDLNTISEEEALESIRELKKTSLLGALETVDLLFQIENVPRSFTHQLVRNRVGATYHQESLRFATKTGGFDYDIGGSVKTDEQMTTFTDAMEVISAYYDRLIERGVEPQDARGVLPINVNTKIGFKVNFRTLIKMCEVRLCYQSQPHWFKIASMMKKEVEQKVHPVFAEFLVPYCERAGKCGYKAIFDRECPKETAIIKRMEDKLIACDGDYEKMARVALYG